MHTENEYSLDVDRHRALVILDQERPVLSSAILGGGLCRARSLLNVRVDENFHGRKSGFGDPGEYLEDKRRQWSAPGPCVAMMTAASMRSFRRSEMEGDGLRVAALVTAGLSNAGRAGDEAEWTGRGYRPGTINMFVLTNAALSPPAMVEAVAMATEAKAVAVAECGAKSVVSGRTATGTGTDSVAVVSGLSPYRAEYCGKHTLLGHLLAKAVLTALADSLSWYGRG